MCENNQEIYKLDYPSFEISQSSSYISIIHSSKENSTFDINAGNVCTNLSFLTVLRLIMTFSFSLVCMSINFFSPSRESHFIAYVSRHIDTTSVCPGLIFTVSPAYEFSDLIKKWNDKFLKSAPPSSSYMAF